MSARRSGIGGVRSGAAVPPTGPDRRRTTRIDAVIRATVRQSDLPEPSVLRARVVDISDHGVRLLLRRLLPKDSRVVLDLECELPLRVHLGYDADALVVDGPMHTHVVRIAGTVTRAQRLPNRLWEVGVEFCPDTTRFEELQVMRFYVDHLREQDSWTI
jgi:c-di-GMP-binding flagellar brake protein YcgR